MRIFTPKLLRQYPPYPLPPQKKIIKYSKSEKKLVLDIFENFLVLTLIKMIRNRH